MHWHGAVEHGHLHGSRPHEHDFDAEGRVVDDGWRDAYGRPRHAQAAVAAIREQHVKGYRSTSDEVYERQPICQGCGHAWPCDTAIVLAALLPPHNGEPSDATSPAHSGGSTAIDP